MGLAIGLSASLLIALWVFDELSYDRYHEKSGQIYRLERHIAWDGKVFDVPVTGAIFGETIADKIPEIVDFTRVYPIELSIWNHLNSNQEERVMFCDKGFFNVFTYNFERGDPSTALSEPFTVVLTKKAAVAYFGEEYPIDKTLEIEWNDERKKFRVTGIIEEVPSQSHFHFDVIASFETLEELMPDRLDSWVSNYLYTYVLLHPESKPEDLSAGFRGIVEEFIAPAYMAFLGGEQGIKDIHEIFVITLRPVEDIHLTAKLMWDIEPQGNMTSVYIFSIVSILILLMACFNFMNLSTALGSKRAREVGIRKTVGATRGELIVQFISESIIISFISLGIALLIIETVLPGFNGFVGKHLTLSSFFEPQYFLILSIIVIGCGVLAGLYPAFYLSKFNPMIVLHKNEEPRGSRFSVRQILVVFQFSISILLIIGTITAYIQINYFYEKPLGYDQENLFVISTESSEVRNNLETYKSRVLQYPETKDVTTSGSIPAAINFSDKAYKSDDMEDVISSIYIGIGYNFFETYKIEFLAGRPFSKEYGTDTIFKYIVNEQVIRKIGIANPEDAIGKHYGTFDKEGDFESGEIIGVVKNFHIKPLDKEIEPITFELNPDWMEYITIRYNTSDLQGFILKMEKVWKEIFPNDEYNYFILKDRYKSLYIEETRMKNILLSFTILAIFVGCLGLFGLAAFIAQQRSKEIGIRKVHGAPVGSIIFLLTRQFTYWVLLANVIAWPLAYYLLDDWLSNFFYRISMPYWVFIAAGLLALVVALLTVGYKAYKAAVSDPLDSIKYE